MFVIFPGKFKRSQADGLCENKSGGILPSVTLISKIHSPFFLVFFPSWWHSFFPLLVQPSLQYRNLFYSSRSSFIVFSTFKTSSDCDLLIEIFLLSYFWFDDSISFSRNGDKCKWNAFSFFFFENERNVSSLKNNFF